MFYDIFYTRFERLDTGQLESSEWHVTPLDWHFFSGDSVHALVDYDRVFERLFEPFEISPGVVLQPGDYRFNRFRTTIAFVQPSLPLANDAYRPSSAPSTAISVRVRQSKFHLP